jgi:hypothetical protein
MPNFMKKCFNKGCRTGIPGAILFFVLFSMQMGSCVEVDNTFGTEYIPDNQIMRVLRDSTFRIDTYNVTNDSLVTSGMLSGYIGGYHDPLSGSAVDAGLIFQIEPLSDPDSLVRPQLQIDSAFLVLGITDRFGKTDVEQTFDLYELTRPIHYDSVYYNRFDPTPILESSPLLNFTLSGDETAIKYDLKGLPLIDRLIDTANYRDYKTLREQFEGFYIKPRQAMQDAALHRVDLSLSTTTSNGIWLYYRYYVEKGDSMSSTKTAFYRVDPPSTDKPTVNQSVNVVTHDFSNVKPEVRLNDRSVPVPTTYMQGFAGIKTSFEFTRESVDALKEKVKAAGFTDLVVNKAKLQIRIPERDPERLDRLEGAYGRLGMFYDYNKLDYIPDFNYVYEAYNQTTLPYGGYLNRSRYLYEMDITTYVQRLFREGYDQNSIDLAPDPSYAYALDAFALNGSASTEPPLLVITYTMIR